MDRVLPIFNELKIELNLWEMQTVFFNIGRQIFGLLEKKRSRTERGKRKRFIPILSSQLNITNIRFMEG